MKINRRQLLAGVAAMGSVASRQVIAQEQWFPVTGDNGKPVANMRLPVELTSEIDFLEGIVWVAQASPGRDGGRVLRLQLSVLPYSREGYS